MSNKNSERVTTIHWELFYKLRIHDRVKHKYNYLINNYDLDLVSLCMRSSLDTNYFNWNYHSLLVMTMHLIQSYSVYNQSIWANLLKGRNSYESVR